MIKFVTERPEYSDVCISTDVWAYSDFESASISIEQSGTSITIASSDVDAFIEALVLARTAAETKLAEQKAQLTAV